MTFHTNKNHPEQQFSLKLVESVHLGSLRLWKLCLIYEKYLKILVNKKDLDST
jgi:hypothetical protein